MEGEKKKRKIRILSKGMVVLGLRKERRERGKLYYATVAYVGFDGGWCKDSKSGDSRFSACENFATTPTNYSFFF